MGSNDGLEYMARIDPVRGSRATTEPSRPASWAWATFWSLSRTVRVIDWLWSCLVSRLRSWLRLVGSLNGLLLPVSTLS